MSLLQPRRLIPIAAAFAFFGLAAAIVSGRNFAFDSTVVMFLRQANDASLPLGPPWVREMMRDITALGSFIGLGTMTIAASLTLWLCRHRRLALNLVISVLLALLVSTILKVTIGRERPSFVEHLALSSTASFPSGHAFMSAVTLLSIAAFVGLAAKRRDITRLCITLAWMIVSIGASRVYLGVHWPTDVVAGWCLGVAWSSSAIAWVGWRKHQDERHGLEPSPQ